MTNTQRAVARSRALSVCLIFVLAGTTVAATPNRRPEKTNNDAATKRKPPATPQAVGAALADLERSLEARAEGIPKTPFPQNTSCPSPGYVRTSVHFAYANVRAEVFATLQAPEAAPLRALLESEFPREPTVRQDCGPAGNDGIDERAVKDFFAGLRAFLNRARDLARPMKVIVSSNRSDSLSTIRPEAGGSGPAESWTESTYRDLFRGYYHLTVRHKTDAYKKYDKDFGKLAGDEVKIVCDLAAKSSAQESICAVKQ